MSDNSEKKIVAAHDQRESSEYVEHFGAHEKRKESSEFRHTKHRLEKELGLCCAICLLNKLSSLIAEGKLPASPGECILSSGVKTHPVAWYLRKAGELQVYPTADKPFESHHYVVEWAHWTQADTDKVNWFGWWQDPYGLYAEGLASGRPPISSPDDDRTQLILCQEHHRGEDLGIHHVPWPTYSAMFVVKDNEIILQRHREVLPKEQFGDHITPENSIQYEKK